MRHRRLLSELTCLLAALLICQTMQTAQAFAASPGTSGTNPKSPGWREGWVVGIGILGGGNVDSDCSNCYAPLGAGIHAQVGRMINPRLALLLDTHGTAVRRPDRENYGAASDVLVQEVAALAVQVWPGERLWIEGGIGGGEVRGSAYLMSPNGTSSKIIETQTGLGVLAAVGYEVFRSEAVGLNLHARWAGTYADNLSRGNLLFALGLAWYQ